MKLFWDIFIAFFKIGALTFGGGYAMLPMVQKEVIEKKSWVSEEEMMDYYAVAQVLPGVIAVNMSLFLGNRIRGKAGGVVAALGVVAPSLIIIMVIAAFLDNFLEYEMVQRAFYGIRIVVCALIIQAVIKMWKTAVKDVFGLCVYLVALGLALWGGLPVAVLVLAAVLAGVIAGSWKRKAAEK